VQGRLSLKVCSGCNILVFIIFFAIKICERNIYVLSRFFCKFFSVRSTIMGVLFPYHVVELPNKYPRQPTQQTVLYGPFAVETTSLISLPPTPHLLCFTNSFIIGGDGEGHVTAKNDSPLVDWDHVSVRTASHWLYEVGSTARNRVGSRGD
jgi:hypothetical protein